MAIRGEKQNQQLDFIINNVLSHLYGNSKNINQYFGSTKEYLKISRLLDKKRLSLSCQKISKFRTKKIKNLRTCSEIIKQFEKQLHNPFNSHNMLSDGNIK